MKKLLMVLLTMFSLTIFACEVLLDVEDNKDGYITIYGGFSSDESTDGVTLMILKDKLYNGEEETFNDRMVLFKTTLDETGEIRIPKPKTSKYIIVFDGGEGHYKERKGAKLTAEEENLWQEAMKNDKILGIWKEKMQDKVK